MSWSRNASSPEIAPPAATSSNRPIPRSSVCEKRSSSARIVSAMRSRFSSSSGYQYAICSVTRFEIRQKSFSPIPRACWTARRITRRSTYPRPSFDGSTPSATRKVMPRPWSAMIRWAFVAFSELVHATPLSASIQSINAWKPSVS